MSDINVVKDNEDNFLFTVKDELERYKQYFSDTNSLDNLFKPYREKDLEKYWYLKCQPLVLEESENLCNTKTILSLLQVL